MKGDCFSFARVGLTAAMRLGVVVLLATSIVLNLVSGVYSGFLHAHEHEHADLSAHDHDHTGKETSGHVDLAADVNEEHAIDAPSAAGGLGGDIHEHGPEIILLQGVPPGSNVLRTPRAWLSCPECVLAVGDRVGLERPPRA